MSKKTLCLIALSLFVLLVFSVFWNCKQYIDYKGVPVKIEEKTVVKYIEKKDSMPTAKTEKVVGKIKVKKKSCDESQPTKTCNEGDVDSLELEITQKVYTDDSTYTAYVSGYMSSLDSIFVSQKEITHSVIETRTIESKKFRRWNVGLAGGYGYGLSSKTFEPFVGIVVTLSLF